MYDSRYYYPKPLFRFQNNRMVLTNVPVPRKNGPRADSAVKNSTQHSFFISLAADSALCNLIAANLARFPSIRQYMEDSRIIIPRAPGYEWEYAIYEPLQYRVSENVLKEIGEQGYESRVIDSLKNLSGKNHSGASRFKTALHEALGSEPPPAFMGVSAGQRPGRSRPKVQISVLGDHVRSSGNNEKGHGRVRREANRGYRAVVVIQVYPDMWVGFS